MSKTKKFAALALSVTIAAGLLATAAGCCRHAHDTKSVNATCTEAGYYEDICFKCGNVNERYETSPALGHDFEGGFCTRCGETDPDDTSLGDEAGRLALSSQGVLSWNKLKKATKYELKLTLPNEPEKVYEFPRTQGSVNLEEIFGKDDYNKPINFPAGRTFARFVHYELYEEQIEGEQIDQEYPVDEDADEFRIIKRNGKYEMERMGYADENVKLTGFYSDKKTDETGDYYLYEFKLDDGNKPVQLNISKQIKLSSGNRISYYKTADDRASGRNAVSSFEMPYFKYPAGATTWYTRISLQSGDYADYDLRVYGLRTLKVTRYVTSGEFSGSLDGASRTQIGNSTEHLEGDIVPGAALLSGVNYACSVRDEAYNYIGVVRPDSESGVTADYTVRPCGSGDEVKLYFNPEYYDGKVKAQAEEYAEIRKTYGVAEVWESNQRKGCNLTYSNVGSSTTAEIPGRVCGMRVLSADFQYSLVSTINIPAAGVLPELLLNYNVTTVNLGFIDEIGASAFVGANGNLVINCAFGEEYAERLFHEKWNNKNSSEKFTTNFNV